MHAAVQAAICLDKLTCSKFPLRIYIILQGSRLLKTIAALYFKLLPASLCFVAFTLRKVESRPEIPHTHTRRRRQNIQMRAKKKKKKVVTLFQSGIISSFLSGIFTARFRRLHSSHLDANSGRITETAINPLVPKVHKISIRNLTINRILIIDFVKKTVHLGAHYSERQGLMG